MSREGLDARHGRQGGRVVPFDLEVAPVSERIARAPRCEVCGGPMMLGQRRYHFACSPPLSCCGVPVDLVPDPVKHKREHLEP